MDTVNPGTRRDAARAKLAEAQAAMLQAASAAVVKGDPLAGQLQALALCVGGLTEIYEASEATRLETPTPSAPRPTPSQMTLSPRSTPPAYPLSSNSPPSSPPSPSKRSAGISG